MVSVGVSKLGCTERIFVDPGAKIKDDLHDIDELRQRLITVWCGLEQRAVDDAL